MKFPISILSLLLILIISCKDAEQSNADTQDKNSAIDKNSESSINFYGYCDMATMDKILLENTPSQIHVIAETMPGNENIGLEGTFSINGSETITGIEFKASNGFKNVKNAVFRIDPEYEVYSLYIVLEESEGEGANPKYIALEDFSPEEDFITVINVNGGYECQNNKGDEMPFIPLKKGHSFKRPRK